MSLSYVVVQSVVCFMISLTCRAIVGAFGGSENMSVNSNELGKRDCICFPDKTCQPSIGNPVIGVFRHDRYKNYFGMRKTVLSIP